MSIPVEVKEVPCRFGDHSPAVGRYKTPEGCVCYPDDREQDLCAQHIIKDGMIGERVELILVYQPSFYENWWGRDQIEFDYNEEKKG